MFLLSHNTVFQGCPILQRPHVLLHFEYVLGKKFGKPDAADSNVCMHTLNFEKNLEHFILTLSLNNKSIYDDVILWRQSQYL